MPTFTKRTEIPAPAAELDRWHERPGAFERLVPPLRRVEILERTGGLDVGARVVLRVGRRPFAMRWSAVHTLREPGRRFVDVQESGPFARFVHEHLFEDSGEGRSALHDRVDYALPMGAFGQALGGRLARRELAALFCHRHRVTASDLARHAPYFGTAPLRVAVTGASGLVGSALCAFLTAGGHDVVRFVRGRAAGPSEIAWSPAAGAIERDKLEGLDAVVHLAGENIAAKRWTGTRKAAILASRDGGTGLLARTVAELARKPRVFVSASAVGFYGPRGDEAADESAPPGNGFLAEVCRAWEAATQPAALAGVRTVTARLGVVLSGRGGALAKMLPAFRCGAGGPIGNGRQGLSWIGLDDAVYAIHHLIRQDGASGPVNVVAPGAVAQREFAIVLGRALRRPAFAPLPALAVKAIFGELGEELLLTGQFVEPGVLRRSGFTWSAPSLREALEAALGLGMSPGTA